MNLCSAVSVTREVLGACAHGAVVVDVVVDVDE
jgi:hypothetical protein